MLLSLRQYQMLKNGKKPNKLIPFLDLQIVLELFLHLWFHLWIQGRLLATLMRYGILLLLNVVWVGYFQVILHIYSSHSVMFLGVMFHQYWWPRPLLFVLRLYMLLRPMSNPWWFCQFPLPLFICCKEENLDQICLVFCLISIVLVLTFDVV